MCGCWLLGLGCFVFFWVGWSQKGWLLWNQLFFLFVCADLGFRGLLLGMVCVLVGPVVGFSPFLIEEEERDIV